MDKTLESDIRTITIATANKVTSKNWKNRNMTIAEFFKELQTPISKDMTREEYQKLDKVEKGKAKDVRAFVGGALKTNGVRSKDNVISRDLITLDIDECKGMQESDLINIIRTSLNKYTFLAYPTLSNIKDSPRYRVIIPLDRTIKNKEKYEAICRAVAHKIDESMNIFDRTGYQWERLMYYPCKLTNEEYKPIINQRVIINADEILGEYDLLGNGWQDRTEWYYSENEKAKINKIITDKQAEPKLKPGIIGAFCRAYSISEAIDKFIPDDYLFCSTKADEARYTYTKGSTTGGALVYDDKFLYSHHSTDPSCEILCNAFDLIRIHKFGELDENVKGRPSKEPSSFKAMMEFASKDQKTSEERAKSEFGIVEEDFEWFNDLEKTEKGDIKNTITNMKLIMLNDSNLKGKIVFNEFSSQIEKNDLSLPWRPRSYEISDHDLAGLKEYIQRVYKLKGNSNYDEGLILTAYDKYTHPVRDYLESISWDGELRAERLFIDYLGAEDSDYTKAVTIKMLLAAVTRVFDPGHKFDNMLVLQGDQGIGKSTILKKLAVRPEWFNDNKVNVEDSKKIMESYGGCWIVEIAELSSFNKKTAESIKSFISDTQFKSRLAFGRASTTYKVQYVLFGSTNDDKFLSDKTGNRRFWVLNCNKDKVIKNVWKDLDKEVSQIWGEVYHRFKAGEDLILPEELLKEATEKQDKHLNNDLQDALLDRFNFDIPEDKWIKRTPTDVIDVLHLSDSEKRLAKRELKQVLSKMGIEQHKSKSMRYYVVPPIREEEFCN